MKKYEVKSFNTFIYFLKMLQIGVKYVEKKQKNTSRIKGKQYYSVFK